MYLIKKSDPDNRNDIPALSPYEQNLIRYSRSLSWQQENDLVQRLAELKDQYWIFCDCGGPQPVIIICKAMNGDFYLRRQARTGHTLQCVFRHDDVEVSLISSQLFRPSKKLKIFCPYQYAQNISTPSDQHVSHRHSSTIKKMGQLLYTIMTEAQFHQIDFGSIPKIIKLQEDKSDEELKKIKQTYINSLREALGRINIFDKVSLKEFTHYSLSRESFTRVRGTLLNCQKSWPSHIKPFILFLNTAQEITLNTIINKYEVIQPVCCIQTTSPWIDKQKKGTLGELPSFVSTNYSTSLT